MKEKGSMSYRMDLDFEPGYFLFQKLDPLFIV